MDDRLLLHTSDLPTRKGKPFHAKWETEAKPRFANALSTLVRHNGTRRHRSAGMPRRNDILSQLLLREATVAQSSILLHLRIAIHALLENVHRDANGDVVWPAFGRGNCLLIQCNLACRTELGLRRPEFRAQNGVRRRWAARVLGFRRVSQFEYTNFSGHHGNVTIPLRRNQVSDWPEFQRNTSTLRRAFFRLPAGVIEVHLAAPEIRRTCRARSKHRAHVTYHGVGREVQQSSKLTKPIR